MTTAYHTDRSDPTIDRIIRLAFPTYKGHTICLRSATNVELKGAYWDGGSRSSYAIANLSTGTIKPLPHYNPPQFGGPKRAPILSIPVGGAVLEHVIFCGKDMGIYFHVHPDSLAPLLPDTTAADLSLEEKIVLEATAALTSAGRKNERERWDFPFSVWDAAKKKLISKGFLRKNGAITNEGKNARPYGPGSSGLNKLFRQWRKENGLPDQLY